MAEGALDPPVYPTLDDLLRAHARFVEHEPRDLFYRVASELIRLSLAGETTVSVGEALAVLLQTWNAQRYRFHGGFDRGHFAQLDALLAATGNRLQVYRTRSLLSLAAGEREEMLTIFSEFEEVLGPVGAAKALHLLAPHLFPLWDWAIARKYRCSLGGVTGNAGRYWSFMQMTKAQWLRIPAASGREDLLKLLDEYNYGHFTRDWL